MKKLLFFLAALALFSGEASAQFNSGFSNTNRGGGGTTAPLMSSVNAGAITSSGATITWNTTPAGDTQVCYATTANPYPGGTCTSVTNTSPTVTSHSVALSGLTTGTTYHYQAVSNQSGTGYTNKTVSVDATFTPAASYQGPGDFSAISGSIGAFWGLTPYSSTYTGNVASIVDGHTTHTNAVTAVAGGTLASTPDTIATIKTDCTSTAQTAGSYTCTMPVLYDQSGANSCVSSGAVPCHMQFWGGGVAPTVFSDCPAPFPAGTLCFLIYNNGTTQAYLSTANYSGAPTYTTANGAPFSLTNLMTPKAIGTVYATAIPSLSNSAIEIAAAYQQYHNNVNGTAHTIVLNTGPTAGTWEKVMAADNQSASTNGYFQINGGALGTPITAVTSANGNPAGSIGLGPLISGDYYYVEEFSIYKADIHANFTTLYSTYTSPRFGGF